MVAMEAVVVPMLLQRPAVEAVGGWVAAAVEVAGWEGVMVVSPGLGVETAEEKAMEAMEVEG